MTEDSVRSEQTEQKKTVLGKYLSIFLVLNAILLAVVCASILRVHMQLAVLGLFGACWVALRGFRAWSGRIEAGLPAIVITIGLFVLCMVALPASEERWDLQFVVPVCLAALLTATGCTDTTHFWSNNIVNQDGRSRTRDFVMRHGLRGLWYGFLGFITIYAFVVPLIQEWQFRQLPPTDDPLLQVDRLTLVQNILFKFCESMTAGFFFIVGSCVGSFLNVVIYRVPLGISVLVKPSHCPGCSEKIHGKDNLPIVGWLKLKGACRNCETTISSRYPTVELVVGLTFLVLYFVELISGGTNLPGRMPNGYAGVLWILFYTKWDLVGLYLLHCLLMCTVFAWAMIRRDGNRVPVGSILLMAAMIAVPICMSHDLQPLAGLAKSNRDYSASHDMKMMGITTGLGLGAGLLIGGVAYFLNLKGPRLLPADLASWLLVGLTLGWQAVVGVTLLCLIWKFLCVIHRAVFDAGEHDPKTANLYLVLPWITLVHHCVWRNLFSFVTGS